jgi:hypothetical protein
VSRAAELIIGLDISDKNTMLLEKSPQVMSWAWKPWLLTSGEAFPYQPRRVSRNRSAIKEFSNNIKYLLTPSQMVLL